MNLKKIAIKKNLKNIEKIKSLVIFNTIYWIIWKNVILDYFQIEKNY